MIKSRRTLLAGVSALAMLVSAAEANAAPPFTTPGKFEFMVTVPGEYAIDILGASGGNGLFGDGGLGAEVTGDVLLKAGQDLTLYVGGRGQSLALAGSVLGGGGGGGSFVFLGTNVLAVAGGGGGASYAGVIGGPGLAETSGGAGGGLAGGVAGASGNGGGGGTYMFPGVGLNGGGGAGVNSGAVGYGGDGAGGDSGGGGKFPNGGAGSHGYGYGNAGGFGGGGGGGDEGGGGGSGFSGGGGGSGGGFIGYGGGGGGSYLSSLVTAQVLTAGVNSGDGSISISLLPSAVPEPSTWAMTLAGFAGLGWLAHMRGRKTSPGLTLAATGRDLPGRA